ncbi:protein of unknown function [Nocardioides scoriae]|uniref:MrfA-like Zn-binding domain-containing protein n=1 Tax=Nocardioides scoriae TaxID=642780 RepID=A0A1H1V194_9ACTN|nr:protein of unknown function [Nocardioides scoriae]
MVRKVAEARRSQMVTTYGVGALFPARDESFMLLGTDDWTESQCPEVTEPRLARSMEVRTFRMPPSRGKKDLPVVRFPRMFHCPKCHRLGRLNDFCGWDGNECDRCQRTLVPSRFVICCPGGHIDDFPYSAWVHKGERPDADKSHQLFLRTRGQSSSLGDIVISCSCGAPGRSLAGSFSPQALIGISKCWGNRPWLRGAAADTCDQTPRTLQRGASNVWFASVRSAISIPPWSEGAHRTINKYWPMVQHIPAAALAATLVGMDMDKEAGVEVDDLVQAILVMRGEASDEIPDDADLRADEYGALVKGRPEKDPRQQFVCTRVEGLPDEANRLLTQVSEVARLREVRALQGFTRVTPWSEGEEGNRVAPLTAQKPTWLPAIEVLGEGVFFQIDETALATWEAGDFAKSRAKAIEEAYRIRAEAMGVPHVKRIGPRELLLHSLAHALLTELSLDAGYPVASLRERVYSKEGQAGILIYTASADSAGSLGGLAAQSRADRVWPLVLSATRRARWCSSDPVCIETVSGGADALNLAACHACQLLPETSCELANRELDRACLVGLPDRPEDGFLNSFVD